MNKITVGAIVTTVLFISGISFLWRVEHDSLSTQVTDMQKPALQESLPEPIPPVETVHKDVRLIESEKENAQANPADQSVTVSWHQPLDRAQERVTKKPFGIYVAPGNSPVSPEIFTGYHTGADFEIFSDESEIDVFVYAMCDGEMVMKQYVSGYGGVVVQVCSIEGEAVTVLYGHLKLSSIEARVGTVVHTGENIGVLGKGYSTETDGERKHLHVSVHKGGVN